MFKDYDGTTAKQPLYVISVAANMVGLHPQTLRHYESLGLVKPKRTAGKIRLYAPADIDRLHQIRRLTDDLGVNLAGVQIILDMRSRLERLQLEMGARQAELEAEIARLRQRLIVSSQEERYDDQKDVGGGNTRSFKRAN